MTQSPKGRQPRMAQRVAPPERIPPSRVREVEPKPPMSPSERAAKAMPVPPEPTEVEHELPQAEPSIAALPNVEPAMPLEPPQSGEPAPRPAEPPVERQAAVPEALVPEAPPAPVAPVASTPSAEPTIADVLKRVDDAWQQFRVRAGAFPNERMDERLDGGWTRKQMLAHIAAWHDLTHDRLGKMLLSGQPEPGAGDIDAFNARVARQAIGRTGGEVVKEMDMTFSRLRRQLARLTDEQLAANDGWAVTVIAGNTYDHYVEHSADVYQPPATDGRKR